MDSEINKKSTRNVFHFFVGRTLYPAGADRGNIIQKKGFGKIFPAWRAKRLHSAESMRLD